MKKLMMRFKQVLLVIIITLFICQINNAESATGWEKTKPLGTSSASDLDTAIAENNAALDLVLAGYHQNAEIVYLSSSTLTINAGTIVCSNSDGSIRLMARNTSDFTLTWSYADCSEANSTTYYIYAYMTAVTDTTFLAMISTSPSTPSGGTYYHRLGSFYNNSSGNITLINNDDDLSEFGDWESKSAGVTYQALTDGYAMVYSTTTVGVVSGKSDSANPPTTLRSYCNDYASFTMPVKKGDYWLISGSPTAVFWVKKQ